MFYLQQLLPSQHAGFPQHVWAVAAWADNESKRAAVNVNKSALSFMRSPLKKLYERTCAMGVSMRSIGSQKKEMMLNAEVVFEIKHGSLVTKAGS